MIRVVYGNSISGAIEEAEVESATITYNRWLRDDDDNPLAEYDVKDCRWYRQDGTVWTDISFGAVSCQ